MEHPCRAHTVTEKRLGLLRLLLYASRTRNVKNPLRCRRFRSLHEVCSTVACMRSSSSSSSSRRPRVAVSLTSILIDAAAFFAPVAAGRGSEAAEIAGRLS